MDRVRGWTCRPQYRDHGTRKACFAANLVALPHGLLEPIPLHIVERLGSHEGAALRAGDTAQDRRALDHDEGAARARHPARTLLTQHKEGRRDVDVGPLFPEDA